jgi:hypothetical protein
MQENGLTTTGNNVDIYVYISSRPRLHFRPRLSGDRYDWRWIATTAFVIYIILHHAEIVVLWGKDRCIRNRYGMRNWVKSWKLKSPTSTRLKNPLSPGRVKGLSTQHKKSVFRSSAWTVAPPGGQQGTSRSIALAVIRSRLVRLVSCEVLNQKLRKNDWIVCKRMFNCSQCI